jgi:hypothetical protein
MPPSRWRPTHELTGAFLAGAWACLLAAARLDAFPGCLLMSCAILGGLLCCVFWLPVLLARGLARSPSGQPGAVQLLRGLLLTGLALVLLDLASFVALRQLAVISALVPHRTLPATLALPAGLAAAAATLAWLGLRFAPRLAQRIRPWPFLGIAAGLLPLLAWPLAWRAPDAPDLDTALPPAGDGPPQLRVLGIDAVGVEIFERYAHRMPALSAFAAEAARGVLQPEPPYLSPAIWTSIATGRPAAQHGVSNYELWADHPSIGTVPIDRFYTDPSTSLLILPAIAAWRAGWLGVLPSTRLHREGEPFWQGRQDAGVVCWPATWPADSSAGLVVSDRWPPDRTETLFQYRADLPAQVQPEAAARALASMRRDPAEPADPELLAMVPFTDRERRAFHAALEDDLAAPRDQPFSNLHYAWLNDRSCLAAATWMLETRRPRVAVIYLMGPDLVGHAFLPDEQGRVAGFEDPDATRLAEVFPAYLERLDHDLAVLLAHAGPETTTVVITDHGLQHQGTGLFSVWHAGDGMVLVEGGGVEAGADLGARPAQGWLELLSQPLPQR